MKRKSKIFTGLLLSALALTVVSAISIFGQEKGVVVQRERVIQGPEGPGGDEVGYRRTEERKEYHSERRSRA